jgi:hypothetical protein
VASKATSRLGDPVAPELGITGASHKPLAGGLA